MFDAPSPTLCPLEIIKFSIVIFSAFIDSLKLKVKLSPLFVKLSAFLSVKIIAFKESIVGGSFFVNNDGIRNSAFSEAFKPCLSIIFSLSIEITSFSKIVEFLPKIILNSLA